MCATTLGSAWRSRHPGTKEIQRDGGDTVDVRGATNSLPRVLFVTSMWPADDEPWRGSFVKAQAESLQRIGVRVDVEQIRAHGSWPAYTSAARRLILDRTDNVVYDLVHAHYGHAALVARLMPGAPLVISYCGGDLNGIQRQDGSLTPRSRVEVTVFRQLARFAQATITKSREMEMRLPAACRARNHVIPSGVDLDRFVPVERAIARKRLGCSVDAPIALFVGDPNLPIKNFRLATAVCELVRMHVPDLMLQVAWGVSPEDMPTWMHAADALLCTSQSEGSPNAVKEAMAAGLPIVSTPVGDVPELLDGVNDCYVRPPEAESLAAALAVAITQGRSESARSAVAGLSLERVAERVLAVYQTVLCGGRGGERRRA
jgi:teichuronic acid biosynthesis glycosyltransferase TuaC